MSSSGKRQRLEDAEAPALLRAAPILCLPQEILSLVCSLLSHPDMITTRLVSHAFDIAVQQFLFRTINLKVSLPSFRRLQKIADSGHLRKHVKAIYYDGRTFSTAPALQGFSSWLQYSCCSGFGIAQEIKDDFVDSFTETQLQRFYYRYCTFLGHQSDLLESNFGIDILKAAIPKLPHLQEVKFDVVRWDDTFEKNITAEKVMSSISPLARQILVEPAHHEAQETSELNFWSLLNGVSLNPHVRQLRLLCGHDLSLRRLVIANPILRDAWRALKNLRHLELHFCSDRIMKTEDDARGLAEMLNGVPFLRFLSISFEYLSKDDRYNARLSQLLPVKQQWQFLKHLALQGVITTEAQFREVLLAHRGTLRSLKLLTLNFSADREDPDVEYGYGSWVRFIQFLSESMLLTSVRFDGLFTNCYDEAWATSEYLPCYYWEEGERYPPDSLRYRVERFITDGGECPFRSIVGVSDDSPPCVSKPSDYRSLEPWTWNPGNFRIFPPWRWEPDESWVFMPWTINK